MGGRDRDSEDCCAMCLMGTGACCMFLLVITLVVLYVSAILGFAAVTMMSNSTMDAVWFEDYMLDNDTFKQTINPLDFEKKGLEMRMLYWLLFLASQASSKFMSDTLEENSWHDIKRGIALVVLFTGGHLAMVIALGAQGFDFCFWWIVVTEAILPFLVFGSKVLYRLGERNRPGVSPFSEGG